ncbi:MAG TPA: polyphosphate kinase 1, partial [bacterium]|nr:polyphosphate kinase 1 [bacterium]
YKKIEQSDLKFPVRESIIKSDFKEKNIFDVISEKDYLLYHPYHSFDPIIDLLNKAAEDENVVAIKQLLYRTADDSQIIKALIKAAEKGKFVTVVFELKARFDEKRNIEWAKKLEDAGAHIIYGLAGYKIHSKALMIIRKEPSGTKKYIHLGTGNYNERTARLYTDLSYLTCDERLGEEVSELFNFLTGFSYPHTLTNIAIAPLNLRKKFLSLIERETENAKKGLKARIIAKMNSLCDKEIVQALYAASLAGVKIDLIVRGICVLRPNLIKISKNIKVKSIVGEFLEHSRIYYFYNAGSPEYYLSSADWMERNLDKRVEILFPIKHDKSKKFLNKILKIQLSKKIRHWELKNNGSYKLIKTNKSNFQSIYSFIIKEVKKQLKKKTINFRIIKKEEI